MKTRQPCLPPLRTPYLLMVRLDDYERNQRIVQSVYPAGSSLQASFVNVGTGEVQRNVRHIFKKTTTLYFVAADKAALAEWHYILQWIEQLQCWGCSCLEGVSGGCAKHPIEVEEYIQRMR